jgi:hypothetical protein
MALSPEIIDVLNKLSSDETREAMKLLYKKMTAEAENLLIPGASYEVSSVYDADEAAHQLLGLLEEYKRQHEHD